MSLPGTILIMAKTSGTRYCRQTQGAVCSTVRVAALDLHFLKHSCLQAGKILCCLLFGQVFNFDCGKTFIEK